MTIDEKKELLAACGSAMREADRLGEEILRWRARAENLSGSILAGMSAPGAKNPIADSVEEIMLLEETLAGKMREVLRLRRRAGAAIDGLRDSRLREVLRLRYLDGMLISGVADAMGYTERQVCNLHRQALAALDLGA